MVKQAVTGTLQPQMQKLDIPENLIPDNKIKKFKAAGFISMGIGLLYMMAMAIVTDVVKNINWQAARILENLIPFGALFIIMGILIMIYGRIMYKREKTPQVIVVNPQQLSQQQPVQNPPLSAPLNQGALPEGERYNPPYTYAPPSITENTTSELKRPPENIRVRQ